MVHDIASSTSTSTGTEIHASENNYLNMRNEMVSLMATATSCNRKHVVAMYMPKLICPSNATCANYFMCTRDNSVSIYALYDLSAINNVTSKIDIQHD